MAETHNEFRYEGPARHRLRDTLKKLMLARGIDTNRLSQETGVPPSNIARMRSNPNTNPTIGNLYPIARYFRVTIEQIMGYAPLPEQLLHSPGAFLEAPVLDFSDARLWKENGLVDDRIIRTLLIETEDPAIKPIAFLITTALYEPLIRKSSFVIIDPEGEPKDSAFVLLSEASGNVSIQRYFSEGNKVWAKDIIPGSGEICPIDETQAIIGTVIEIRYT